jgi:hypothetical protein
MINTKKNKYFIVMDAEYAEWEDEKTSFIAMYAAVALVWAKKIIMFALHKNSNKIARFA